MLPAKRQAPKALTLLASLSLAGCTAAGKSNTATQQSWPELSNSIIFHNAQIYTVNEEQPWAEALAIQSGKITAIGSEADILAQATDDTQLIDLQGRMVMPGFQDPHLHVLEAGLNENLCFVTDFAEAAQYIEEVQDCAEQQRNDAWVKASGANMPNLLEQDRLPIEILDEAVPDRPAVILDDIGHGAWVNSKALEAVGYGDTSSDPPGGILARDPETNQLTGVVLENAQQIFRTASLPPTPENLERGYQGLLTAQKTLAQNGITSVSDAGGYWTRGHHQVWQRAVDESTLTVRASNALYVFPDLPFNQQITDLQSYYSNDPDSLLRFNQAKIYIDGVLGQGTGAMLEPYDVPFGLPGVPDDGFLYFEPDVLEDYSQALEAKGFQLHFHVTGDRGTRLALDSIASATQINGLSDQRHRITHLYLIDEADRPRFKELGTIADFQLAPSSTDPDYADYLRDFLGDRVNELIPALATAEAGATLTLGSDWDADDLSPFVKAGSLMEQELGQELGLAELLKMMTLNVAYLLHQEDTTGSLELGKWADLVVLDQNLFEVKPGQIDDTQVLLTLLGGEVVYQDPALTF